MLAPLLPAHGWQRSFGLAMPTLHCTQTQPTRRLVKETSSWNNKKEELAAEQASCEQVTASLAEVDEEGMRAKMKQASEERDAAQAALNRCGCRGRAGSSRVDDGGGWAAGGHERQLTKPRCPLGFGWSAGKTCGCISSAPCSLPPTHLPQR